MRCQVSKKWGFKFYVQSIQHYVSHFTETLTPETNTRHLNPEP